MASRKRRGMAAGVIAVVVGLALAACSPSGSGNTGNAANTGSGTSGANTGTFVVARTSDIDKLDPYLATAFQTIETLGLVYDELVTVDNAGHLAPDLATKWQVSPDGKTVTFTLRSGVKWQDGDAFTSADVKASIERILKPKTAAVAASNLAMISSVDTPDDTTVVLHLSSPSAALLYALASVNAAIVHTKDIQAGTIGKTPDGTGPFAFKSWKQAQSVTLTANNSYFGGAPAIKTLEFRVIPSDSSILSGMKANAFQLGILSDPAVAQQAGGASNFQLVKEPALAYQTLMLNGRRGALKDQRVRQAIACAIDRKQLIDTAAFGDGKITGPITSPAFQYSPTDGLPCQPGDIQAAKQLMAKAGHAGGITLNTIVPTGLFASAVAEGQNLQSQLAKIGVHLNLQQLAATPYVNAWLAANFDAAVARNGGSYDPYLMYGRYYVTGGSLAKPAGLDSPTLSRLLTEGNSTTDQTKRHEIYGQLQKQLLTESPWVWTYRSDDYYLVSSSVQGFQARPDEALTSLASVTSF